MCQCISDGFRQFLLHMTRSKTLHLLRKLTIATEYVRG
jgi:hypothetical protein